MARDNMTEVVLYTRRYVVTGAISLMPGARLTDYLRESRTFIAVAEAVVTDLEGRELFRTEFLDVHRDSIELALPRALHSDEQPSRGA